MSIGLGNIEPCVCMDPILGHSFSCVVHEPKVVLSPGIPLLGSQTVPLDRFLVVLGHSSSIFVHQPKAALSYLVAPFGQSLFPFKFSLFLPTPNHEQGEGERE